MPTPEAWSLVRRRLEEARRYGCRVINQSSAGGTIDLLALKDRVHREGFQAGFYGRDLTIATARSAEPRKPLRGLQ